jgi:hydroxymethylpyrimidine/phosphomethylpyrimidine kinase
VSRPVALTIAGSDPSGGAGIQADLKTFAVFRVHGASVLAALTAQSTLAVKQIVTLAPEFVVAQLEAVLEDLPVRAAKTGMLASAAVIEAVAAALLRRRAAGGDLCLVVDPVMNATTGRSLLERGALASLKRALLPLALLVTPNLAEAAALSGRPVDGPGAMRDAAKAIGDLGARAVLVKGGHLEGAALDVLFDGRDFHDLEAPRLPGGPVRGTGCTLSAAITAGLARGESLDRAVRVAKQFVHVAIAHAEALGQGAGMIDPLAQFERSAHSTELDGR